MGIGNLHVRKVLNVYLMVVDQEGGAGVAHEIGMQRVDVGEGHGTGVNHVKGEGHGPFVGHGSVVDHVRVEGHGPCVGHGSVVDHVRVEDHWDLVDHGNVVDHRNMENLVLVVDHGFSVDHRVHMKVHRNVFLAHSGHLVEILHGNHTVVLVDLAT